MQDINVKVWPFSSTPHDKRRLNDATLRYSEIAMAELLRRWPMHKPFDGKVIEEKAFELANVMADGALKRGFI